MFYVSCCWVFFSYLDLALGGDGVGVRFRQEVLHKVVVQESGTLFRERTKLQNPHAAGRRRVRRVSEGAPCGGWDQNGLGFGVVPAVQIRFSGCWLWWGPWLPSRNCRYLYGSGVFIVRLDAFKKRLPGTDRTWRMLLLYCTRELFTATYVSLLWKNLAVNLNRSFLLLPGESQRRLSTLCPLRLPHRKARYIRARHISRRLVGAACWACGPRQDFDIIVERASKKCP